MATRFVVSVIQFLKNCHYPPSQDHKIAYFVVGGTGTVVLVGHGPLLVWLWSEFLHEDILGITWGMSPPSLSGAGGALLFMLLVGAVWLLISGYARRGAMLHVRDAHIAQLTEQIERLRKS